METGPRFASAGRFFFVVVCAVVMGPQKCGITTLNSIS
jgi:hypothetical protein